MIGISKGKLEDIYRHAEDCMSRVKDRAHSWSKEYLRLLREMHTIIQNALSQCHDLNNQDGICRLNDDWFASLAEMLEQTMLCMTNIGKEVGQEYYSVLHEVKQLKCYERSLISIYGRRLNLEDVSSAYKEIYSFRQIENRLPIIVTQNKFQDYATLTRTFNLMDVADRWMTVFVDWIHDSGHYLDRMRALSRRPWNNYMSVSDLISVDALQCALFACKRDAFMEDEPFMYINVGSSYEPYKLFHKFQHCFSGEFDRIKCERIQTSFAGKLVAVPRMDSVVLNIYSNAAKYIPKDGQEHSVRTSLDNKDDGVYISVSSVGPYVPEEEIEKIFDFGYRATTADIGSVSGNGVGLANVKRICEDAGYKVWAKSMQLSQEPEWGEFTVVIFVPKKFIL